MIKKINIKVKMVIMGALKENGFISDDFYKSITDKYLEKINDN